MAPVVSVMFEEGGVTLETTVTKDFRVVTQWIEELENSVNLNQLNIGLDAEWTPTKTKPENLIAILQLCVGLKCLIFQVNLADKIPTSLVTFLNNPVYTFTGVEIGKDFKKLTYRKAFLERNKETFGSNIVDLRDLLVIKGRRNNKEGVSMVSLAEMVLGLNVEKDTNARMCIWHKDLNDEQVKYASIDAYLSFEIRRVMLAW